MIKFTDVSYKGPNVQERLFWLVNHVRSRDFKLERWYHHFHKGENRDHWDIITVNSPGKPASVIFRFTHKNTAMLFKLIFGGK